MNGHSGTTSTDASPASQSAAPTDDAVNDDTPDSLVPVSYTHLDVYKRQVWHRGNSPEQRERLLTICRRHQLLVTGGSDWHGKGKPNKLGENLTDEATVEEIVHRGVLPLYR